MARNKFFTDVDLTGNQLKNSKPQYVTGTPPVDDQSPWTNITAQGLSANPADGQLAYETISKTLLVYKTPNSTIQEAGWYTASSQGGSPSPTQSNFFNFDLEIAEDSLVSDNTFVIDVSGIDKQRIWDAIWDEKVIRISIFPEQNADLSRLPIDFPELGNGYENLIATVYDYGVKDFGDDYFMKFIMLSIDCDWSGVDVDEDLENITIDMPPKIVIVFSGDVHNDEVEWSDTAYAIKMNNSGGINPSSSGYPQTIDGRTQYRTLLKSEWDYILNTRAGGTVGSTTNARYVKARIGEKNGLILFPDGIDLPEMELININTPTGGFDDNDPISPEDWDDLEKLGVVFLPCTGGLFHGEYGSDNTVGYYRTSSTIGSNYSSGWVLIFSAYYLSINGAPGTYVPSYASVRLVTDTQNSYGTFAVNSNGDNVHFTRGNLQENVAMGMWRFADQPWKICGMDNELSMYYNGLSPLWRDLFSHYNYQYEDVDPYEDLVGSNAPADWGVWISKKYIPVDELQNNIEELQRGEYPPIWRTPTKNEWEYLLFTRNSSTVSGTTNARFAKAQINSINGLILLPDVFTLPAGITMTNINVSNVNCNVNSYTELQWNVLDDAGCIFLPCSGYRLGQLVYNINIYGKYHSVNSYDSDRDSNLLIRDATVINSVQVNFSDKLDGMSVRFFQDEPNGQFSISNTGKVNIAKSNLQFHCLNKEWRFAPNAWDVIGLDNENIAENYDGWIDLFGYGTSGWVSGAVCYQPWSISLYNSDYLNHNLKGDYKNADWGVYNFRKQLHNVAFSGDYNDLENKPTIPAAQVQADWNQTDNTQSNFIKNKPEEPINFNNVNHDTASFKNFTNILPEGNTLTLTVENTNQNNCVNMTNIYDVDKKCNVLTIEYDLDETKVLGETLRSAWEYNDPITNFRQMLIQIIQGHNLYYHIENDLGENFWVKLMNQFGSTNVYSYLEIYNGVQLDSYGRIDNYNTLNYKGIFASLDWLLNHGKVYMASLLSVGQKMRNIFALYYDGMHIKEVYRSYEELLADFAPKTIEYNPVLAVTDYTDGFETLVANFYNSITNLNSFQLYQGTNVDGLGFEFYANIPYIKAGETIINTQATRYSEIRTNYKDLFYIHSRFMEKFFIELDKCVWNYNSGTKELTLKYYNPFFDSSVTETTFGFLTSNFCAREVNSGINGDFNFTCTPFFDSTSNKGGLNIVLTKYDNSEINPETEVFNDNKIMIFNNPNSHYKTMYVDGLRCKDIV